VTCAFVADHACPAASQKANQGPRGRLPIGDAICPFNPIYVHGMNVAAREACILKDLLTKRTGAKDPLAGLGLSAIQPLIVDVWSQSAILDFVDPHTRGEPPADFDNSLRSGTGFLHLAVRDPAVHELMIRVRQLVEPRSSLGDPDLIHQDTFGLDVSVFPRLFLPSSSQTGDPNASILLPIWVQKDWGPVSAFGGGGCQFSLRDVDRNFCLYGATITRQVLEKLQLGIEVFHQTSDENGARPSTTTRRAI
jgi:hypothetical protein